MYIKFNSFAEWINKASQIVGISPGGVARDFGVTRQTVHNWTKADIIDAYIYQGEEGLYVLHDREQYHRIIEHMNNTSYYNQRRKKE